MKMDTKLAESRMRKFGLFAKEYMPEVVFFSTVIGDKTVLMLAAGGKLTTELLDDLEEAIRVHRAHQKL